MQKFNFITKKNCTQELWYKMPHFLLRHKAFAKLSSTTRELYMLLFDRVSLSISNSYIDAKGAYVFLPVKEVIYELDSNNRTIAKCFQSLEDVGLIERVNIKGNAAKIYVKIYDLNNTDENYRPTYKEYKKSLELEFVKQEKLSQVAEVSDIDIKQEEQLYIEDVVPLPTDADAPAEAEQEELEQHLLLPIELLADEHKLTVALHKLTCYERMCLNNPFEQSANLNKVFNSALIEMLTCKTSMTFADNPPITNKCVYRQIIDHLRTTGELCNLQDTACRLYTNSAKNKIINTPIQYMKAVIMTALKTGDADIQAQLIFDKNSGLI